MRHRRSGGRPAIGLLAALATVCALSFASAQAPAPAPAQDPAAAKPGPDAPARSGSLTAKYRLQERFTTKDEKAAPGAIGQYQIAFRETHSTDDPQDKDRRSIQAIFTERPAELGAGDDRLVTDLVRHYAFVKLTPDPKTKRGDRKMMEDLTIWYHDVVGEVPEVMVLTPKRTLLDEDYRFAINYNFVTNFAYLLPELPVRLGDAWRVSKTGATNLVNNQIRGGSLRATLDEVRPHPKGGGMQQAIISISGRVDTEFDGSVFDTAVNARIEFGFTPATNAEDGSIDGSGAIEKVVLAQSSTLRLAGVTGTKPLKRELILERKRPGSEPLLTIPSPRPTPTLENSWLTFSDPRGRYSLRHPQKFEPRIAPDDPADSIDLSIVHPEDNTFDVVRLTFTERPQGRPESRFQAWADDWKKKGFVVVPGLSEKLPAAGWGDVSVNHMEAAVRAQEDQGGLPARRYCDIYMIQFPRNVGIVANAFTFQDQPEPFRKEVQEMLKTIKLESK